MKTSSILFFVLLMTILTNAQIQYEEAPEKWTMPKKIINRGAYPSVSWDGKKVFFIGYGICYIEKTDTGWSDTTRLGNQVNNQMFLIKPVLSPDGKTIIFTGTEFARLFRSKWNEELNDWDTSKIFNDNGISSGVGYWEVASYLNDTTMILIYLGDGKITNYDSTTGLWSAPVNYPHPSLYIHSDWGSWVSPNRKKHYFAEHYNDNGDLHVEYFNDTLGTYLGSYKLNISFIADSLYNIGEHRENDERFPFLTPDGRTMYFMANYDTTGGNWSIYESKMFIDENGDTVLTGIKELIGYQPPVNFELYDAYPNPFNPTTKISWQSPVSGWQSIRVYDILGREVATLIDEEKSAGYNEVEFDSSRYGNLASGLYFYQLTTEGFSSTKKLVLIK